MKKNYPKLFFSFIFFKKPNIQWFVILCLGVCSINMTAQVDLQITTSRTTGVAPLYVFFDATLTTGLTDTNDLVNADFSWNFDLSNTDPAGTWEITKGMVAGHVFETPGTQTVQCVVTHPDGTTDTETVTINVLPFSGTTYYVSATGDDANDGLSVNTPWHTANFAFSQLGANERILFRRGDTFPEVAHRFQNLTTGAKIIGAYGTGPKPILSVSLAGNLVKDIIGLNNTHDMRIMDLHLIGNWSDTTRLIDYQDSSNHSLALRLELESASYLACTQDDGQALGIFDCYFHNFGVLAIFSGRSRQFSFVGNTVDSLIGTEQAEHAIRVQEGEKQFIAHSSFTNIIDTKSAIQIRGEGQRHVMLYQNRMDRILGVNPTNASTIQAISYVTIEGNYLGQNPAYTGTLRENTPNGINIEATHIAVRNNVIDGYRNAINVSHDYNGVVSGCVDIYNNTANWRPVSPQSNTLGSIVRVRDVSNVKVRNNMISAPTPAQGTIISMGGINTNIVVSDNISTITPEYITDPLPGSAAHLNNASNYQLTAASPAVNAGANDVPVFYDQMNEVKPIDTYKDVGAFEYPVLLPLPVELVQFWGARHENTICLQWQTATEKNNKGFFVERSMDVEEWRKVGFVEGSGNSDKTLAYKFRDEHPEQGVNYYRLKQMDFDNKSVYSNIISINMNTELSLKIYPNPTTDMLFLEGDLKEGFIQVFQTDGQLVRSAQVTSNDVQILDFSALENGVYFIQIREKNSGQRWIYKVSKNE